MAYSCNDLRCGSLIHFNCSLFCKCLFAGTNPEHTTTVEYFSVSEIGSRNANMAPVQSTQRRSNEIAAMASWMGITGSCIRWIQGIATIQRNVQFMLKLRKIVHQMRASAAHPLGKIKRCWSQANPETIHFDCIPMLYHAILWHLCHASVYRSDFKCVRSAIGCECDHRHTWIARHFGQHWFTGDGETVWQTTNLLMVDGADIPQLHRSK